MHCRCRLGLGVLFLGLWVNACGAGVEECEEDCGEPEPDAEPDPSVEPEPDASDLDCDLDNGTTLDDGDTVDVDCNSCVCAGGTLACTRLDCGGEGCTIDGRAVPSGSSREVDCNVCVCSDGEVSCTERDCDDGSCLEEGVRYEDGDSVPQSMSCRSCVCDEGDILCVSIGCPSGASCTTDGEELLDGESFDDGCNTCVCNDGDLSCTDRACGILCTVDGVEYEHGDVVPSDDRCEVCECTNGVVRCDVTACPEPVCEQGGETYAAGDAVPSPVPDCLQCSCVAMGNDAEVQCEDLGCAVAPECSDEEGRPVPDGSGVSADGLECTCESGQLVCPVPDGACVVRGQTYLPGEMTPDPNSCNTCTCEDGDATNCTEIACPILQLEPCGMSMLEDFAHDDVSIANGFLTIDVTFTGGCAGHIFSLCYDPVEEGTPAETTLHFLHDDGGDTCTTVISGTAVVDLYPLTEAGYDEVFLHLGNDSFIYRTPTE